VGWCGVPMVIRAAAISMSILAGCMPDLPRDVYIEGRFSDEEVALLEDAIAIANRELGDELLGHPVLRYRGRASDDDGFQFADFDDDRALVYVLDPESPEYQWLVEVTEDRFGGYATLSDLLVRPLPRLGGDRDRFRFIALHELGHFLGLTHNPDPGAVMYPGSGTPSSGYTLADREAFCLVYDCATPPR
jgi:hypothetical protein